MPVKIDLGFHRVEIEGLARGEDGGGLGEVAIMWIVKTVCHVSTYSQAPTLLMLLTIDEIPCQHLDIFWSLAALPE